MRRIALLNGNSASGDSRLFAKTCEVKGRGCFRGKEIALQAMEIVICDANDEASLLNARKEVDTMGFGDPS